jgi:hypothetical protein
MFSGALFDRLEVGGCGRVTREHFNAFWVERLAGADTAARAYEVLRRPGVGHITHADVKPLMRDLLVRIRMRMRAPIMPPCCCCTTLLTHHPTPSLRVRPGHAPGP